MELVALERRLADDRREPAAHHPPPEVELEEPVEAVTVADGEVRRRLVVGLDVWDARVVDPDRRLPVRARDSLGALPPGGLPDVPRQRRERLEEAASAR